MGQQDYHRIERAIDYIRSNYREQPSLQAVAGHVGLSEFHLQKLFKRLAGLSPKRYLQFITASHAGDLLLTRASNLDTTFEVGLSSPSRLHELFVNVHAMTPAEYARGGENLTIRLGRAETPAGPCWIAATGRGICLLHLCEDSPLDLLRRRWPNATIVDDDGSARRTAGALFGTTAGGDFALHVQGTNFQVQTWRALLSIPQGQWASYGDVAAAIGRPGAHRAVASAVARNDVAVLIPCHRVLRADGLVGRYRWGPDVKRVLLAREGLAGAGRRAVGA